MQESILEVTISERIATGYTEVDDQLAVGLALQQAHGEEWLIYRLNAEQAIEVGTILIAKGSAIRDGSAQQWVNLKAAEEGQ